MIADGDSTYFLRPLEYHFAIFHTLSSLERESHPSLRLNHHCVPTTFWTRSISAPGKHRLNNHASCPSALQSSKGKTPLREQEEFAFVRTIILAEFFFEILVYLTETAGPFFFFFSPNDWVFQSFPQMRSMANFLSVLPAGDCTCTYANIQPLQAWGILYSSLLS